MPDETPRDDPDRWNVGRLLGWTADFLKRKGAESPRLDAEVLLAHVLGVSRVKLYTSYPVDVDPATRSRFRDLVKRRAEGTPVAYLVGKKEFFSLSIGVSPAVLIPRGDSEHLVVEFLSAFKGASSPRVVDVGTGSGCLALAIAANQKTAEVFAVDLSEPALALARSNAEALGLAARVSFRPGNLLEPVAADGPFDAIVSNPPYIRSGVIPTLDRGVSAYEPHLALDGGVDGLAVVGPLIDQAIPLLKPGGLLLIEIGSDQEAAVRALLDARPDLLLAPTIRDHAHQPRVLRAAKVV